MLLESGDLIPVLSEAVEIPWTKRKNQIMSFLHRGAVTFQTLVYDTNVGDISPLSTYFNPRKWTIEDLNEKFGQICDDETPLEISSGLTVAPGADIKSATLTPRLVLYPPQETMTKSAGQKRDLSAFQFSKNFSPISVWSVPPPSLMEATPQQGSNLPSPPRTSPDQQVKFCLDETCDPIGPPKRRRLSAFDDLTKIKTSQSLKPRAASTSSPWTPLFKSDTLSPFLCLDSLNQDVFENDTSDEDDLEGVRDEQTLARSLRKIAKAFENDSSWTSWKARNPFNVI